MLAKRMLRVAFALVCSLLAQTSHAMLVTPATPEESAVALDQAIVRRNAADTDSLHFKRMHERQFAAQTQALVSAKSAVADSAAPIAGSEAAESIAPYSWMGIGGLAAIPCAVFLLVAWLTRRALACRERERLAMLWMLHPSQAAMEAVKAEPKPSPTFRLDPGRRQKLQEIWALTLARMQGEPCAPDLSPGNTSEPLAPIPTPV
ncbi:MAG TPA: hypothetical protein VKX17_27210 [Planctomycetota bacterium]|nr:hypothetical protein [Planctomycetota bacterium]